MPRTKKPLQTAAPTISSPTTNGSAIQADVLTLVEAATYLRVAEAEVLRLVEEQAVPARQLARIGAPESGHSTVAEYGFFHTGIEEGRTACPGWKIQGRSRLDPHL